MNAFFLFWVVATANLLNPIPIVGGIAIAIVWAAGRVQAAFGVVGFALTVMVAAAYWHHPNADAADTTYLVGAQFVAMAAWTAFVVALLFTVRESRKTMFFLRADRRVFTQPPKSARDFSRPA